MQDPPCLIKRSYGRIIRLLRPESREISALKLNLT